MCPKVTTRKVVKWLSQFVIFTKEKAIEFAISIPQCSKLINFLYIITERQKQDEEAVFRELMEEINFEVTQHSLIQSYTHIIIMKERIISVGCNSKPFTIQFCFQFLLFSCSIFLFLLQFLKVYLVYECVRVLGLRSPFRRGLGTSFVWLFAYFFSWDSLGFLDLG